MEKETEKTKTRRDIQYLQGKGLPREELRSQQAPDQKPPEKAKGGKVTKVVSRAAPKGKRK